MRYVAWVNGFRWGTHADRSFLVKALGASMDVLLGDVNAKVTIEITSEGT